MKKTLFVRCLLASASLHFLLLNPPKGCSSGAGGGDSDIQGSHQIKINIIDKSEAKGDKEACANGFGGIGISFDIWKRGVITNVYKGYPAERAGIQTGDVIIGDLQAIKGEPGTSVRVRVFRGNAELIFDMTRERICTTAEP